MFHSVRCFILSPPGWKLSLNALRIKTATTDNNLPITHQHSCQLPPWLILQPVMYTWLLPVRSENAPRNRSSEINISFASKRFYAYVVITKKKKKKSFGETGHVNSRAQASLHPVPAFSVAASYLTSLKSTALILKMEYGQHHSLLSWFSLS